MVKDEIKRHNCPISFLVNMAAGISHQEDWQEAFSSFCSFWPVSEAAVSLNENVDFGNVLSQEYFIFQLRNHPDISRQLRIAFQGRLFAIKRIFRQPGLASRNIKIIAEELK